MTVLVNGTAVIPFAKRSLSILNYHGVEEKPDPLFPDAIDSNTFKWHMDLLQRYCNVLSIEKAIKLLKEGRLPPCAACITFDDGYANNYEVALPILKSHGLVATFFIASGFLDGGRMWNDTLIEAIRGSKKEELDLQKLGLGIVPISTRTERLEAISHLLTALKHRDPVERLDKIEAIANISETMLPEGLMMTSEQVKALSEAGMGVGGHTVKHPILASVSVDEARQEISDGKAQLEALTGTPVRVFAYPNGKAGKDYTRAHADLVKELDFIGAVTTERGVATQNTDHYQLPRFTPWDRTPGRFLLRLALNRWHTKPESVG